MPDDSFEYVSCFPDDAEGPLHSQSIECNDEFPLRPLFYWPNDTTFELRLAGIVQVLSFRNRNLEPFLKGRLSVVRPYKKFLTLFPAVKCEYLNDLYLWRQAAEKLDTEMLEDLLDGATWRETTWGVWLAALAPSAEYVASLSAKRPALPHSSNLVDLAIASCDGTLVDSKMIAAEPLREIIGLLNCLPNARLPMREFPRVGTLRREIEQLRLTLRRDGLSEAHKLLARGRLGFYKQPYLKWIEDGAVPF